MCRIPFLSAACLVLATLSGAAMEEVIHLPSRPAVIHDRDGITFVRSGPSTAAEAIASVKTGEVFRFSPVVTGGWFPVTLASGVTGWMHHSRIRLAFTPGDLPSPAGPGDGETGLTEWSRSHGIDYYALMHSAARGEQEGMRGFFAIDDADGGMAESHYGVLSVLLHLLGDRSLAGFLFNKPIEYHLNVRRSLIAAVDLGCFAPFSGPEYLRRRFPWTWGVLFPRVVTAWESPDGRYAIRKIFSDPYPDETSRVVKAEVVATRTNNPVFEFTPDDTGRGDEREGSVLWAPDSLAFAHTCHTARDAGDGSSAFHQTLTTVYQWRNGNFHRVAVDANSTFRAPCSLPAASVHQWSQTGATGWDGPNLLRMRQVDAWSSFNDARQRVRTWTLDLRDRSIRDAKETWTRNE